jgi:hypothetical protein
MKKYKIYELFLGVLAYGLDLYKFYPARAFPPGHFPPGKSFRKQYSNGQPNSTWIIPSPCSQAVGVPTSPWTPFASVLLTLRRSAMHTPNHPNFHYYTYSKTLYIYLNIQIQAHLGNLEALGRSAASQAGWQALGVTVSIALGKSGAPNLNFI